MLKFSLPLSLFLFTATCGCEKFYLTNSNYNKQITILKSICIFLFVCVFVFKSYNARAFSLDKTGSGFRYQIFSQLAEKIPN